MNPEPDSTSSGLIATDDFSRRMRERAVDLSGRRLLITDFRGTGQEHDLTLPPNCGGFGRIRHFRRASDPGWPPNPLPIDPACRALGLPRHDGIEAQVFQNAACNWRCWYCFVPFELLSARQDRASWLSAADLLDLYQAELHRPLVIDLTGGQPDLVPEWIPWMMEELSARGLQDSVYLWSDDNLSNDYHFRFLTESQREAIARYSNYGRVCCFKGYDELSFSFNTRADPELFGRQFAIFRDLLAEGLDLYAYATLTGPDCPAIKDAISRFVDQLQAISPNLPLRTVLLEVQVFSPVASRVKEVHEAALTHQLRARDAWLAELDRRFSSEQRALAITDVRLQPTIV